MLEKKNFGILLLFLITGVLFTVAYAFTGVLAPESQTEVKITSFLLGALIFIVAIIINSLLIGWGQKSHPIMTISNGRYFAINAVVMSAMGVLFQLVYFPGIMNNDSIFILRGGLGVSSQHPWMYIIVMRAFRKVAWALGGTDAHAIMAFTFFQIVAVSCTYSICLVWLKNKRVPKIPLLIINAFFLLCPILNLYMITLIKDVPFSLGMMLIFPLMYDLWMSKGELLSDFRFVAAMMFCIALLFFRNNGVYASIALVILLMIAYRKKLKSLLILLVFIVFLIASTKMIQKHANAPYLFREAVGVPLQQIAATVYNDGSISDEELQFVNKVISVQSIKNNYDPYNVDSLKFTDPSVDNEFLNANREEFLKVWFSLLCKNPQIYLDAHLKSTYGFWSFSNSSYKMRYTYLGAFAAEDAFADWMEEQSIETKSILPASVQNGVENFMTNSSVFLGAGTLAWIFIVLLVLLIKKRGRGFILVGLPDLLCFLTLLLATPIAFQWRYALSLAYVIPLMYGVALINTEES